jgi:hypothetical protein
VHQRLALPRLPLLIDAGLRTRVEPGWIKRIHQRRGELCGVERRRRAPGCRNGGGHAAKRRGKCPLDAEEASATGG